MTAAAVVAWSCAGGQLRPTEGGGFHDRGFHSVLSNSDSGFGYLQIFTSSYAVFVVGLLKFS